MSTPSGPATSGGDVNSQIAALAAALGKPETSAVPGEYRKGNILGIEPGDASTAPTVTVGLSGDTTSPIAGVRIASDYSPQMGDMVILAKSGAEFFALCSIARAGVSVSSTTGGWTKLTLMSGHAHNGNSNGDLMYRRVMQDGSWKMQWKGGFTFGGNSFVGAVNLDADYCPASKVSMLCARETASQGGVAVGVDFGTAGGIQLIGRNWTTSDPNNMFTGAGGSFGVGSHTHLEHDGFGTGSGGGFSVSSHDHSMGHTHAASDPTWVTFNGVEYFL